MTQKTRRHRGYRRPALGLACALLAGLLWAAPAPARAADVLETLWAGNHGGAGGELFYDVIATADGGYLAVGFSGSAAGVPWGNAGQNDAIAVKLRADGSVAWAKNYGGAGADGFAAVTATAGGYLAVGHSNSVAGAPWGNAGGEDAIAVRLDADGNISWAQNYGGASNDYFEAVTPIAGGGFLAVGYSYSAAGAPWGNAGGIDAIAVGLDAGGNVNWARNYGGAGTDRFNAVAGFGSTVVAVGNSDGVSTNIAAGNWANAGGTDAIAVALNPADGTPYWARNYGGTGSETFNGVAAGGGGFLAVGSSASVAGVPWGNAGGDDAIAVKLDAGGNMSWARNYGGGGTDVFHAVTPAAGGGFVVAGASTAASTSLGPYNWGNEGGIDAIAVKLDAAGTPTWAGNFGGGSMDYFYAVAPAAGGFVAVGTSGSVSTNLAPHNWGNAGSYDAIAVRVGPPVAPVPTVAPGIGGAVPPTGDGGGMALYLGLLGAAAAGLAVLGRRARRAKG